MLLAVAAEMMWSSIATPLSSINRHITFANVSLVICVAGMGACYALTRIWRLDGAALSMLLVHSSILLICYLLRHNLSIPGRSLADA